MISSSGTLIVYVIIPNPNSSLLITHFDLTSDKIDLTAFEEITKFDQLVLTEGSVIITLRETQFVRILHHQPSDMSADSFYFYVAPTGTSKTIQTLSAVSAALIAVGGFIVLSQLVYRLYLAVHPSKFIPGENFFLGTITDGMFSNEDKQGSLHLDESNSSSDSVKSELNPNENGDHNSVKSNDIVNSRSFSSVSGSVALSAGSIDDVGVWMLQRINSEALEIRQDSLDSGDSFATPSQSARGSSHTPLSDFSLNSEGDVIWRL